jgi:cystathionine beta-lyase/cystathionine gamma-synthase
VKAGEEIAACRDIYGGTYRLFTRILPQHGITVRFVDTTHPEAVEEALVRKPRLVLLETPTNPLQRITDIAHLAARVHESKLFAITVSFGGVASSISMPAYMSHASIPKNVRHASGLPEDLVRVSVGIEHPDDLIEDLTTAIEDAAAHPAADGSGARRKNADVAEPSGEKVERGNE